jgi:hypothetical protein
MREVDVLVDGAVGGFHLRIAIDAKFRARVADVTAVEAFLGLCADVGANKGLLITVKGFSQAAASRAYNDPSDVELDVLNFADLHLFQAVEAIPYSGTHAVALRAPFGWIIDGTRRDGAVGTLYQRGLDFPSACAAREWMYINFWNRKHEIGDLEALVNSQDERLRADNPGSALQHAPGPQRKDAVSRVRVLRAPLYPAVEITGFLEFPEFIFFSVLFTPEEHYARNLRKLEYLLRTAMPISVVQHQ